MLCFPRAILPLFVRFTALTLCFALATPQAAFALGASARPGGVPSYANSGRNLIADRGRAALDPASDSARDGLTKADTNAPRAGASLMAAGVKGNASSAVLKKKTVGWSEASTRTHRAAISKDARVIRRQAKAVASPVASNGALSSPSKVENPATTAQYRKNADATGSLNQGKGLDAKGDAASALEKPSAMATASIAPVGVQNLASSDNLNEVLAAGTLKQRVDPAAEVNGHIEVPLAAKESNALPVLMNEAAVDESDDASSDYERNVAESSTIVADDPERASDALAAHLSPDKSSDAAKALASMASLAAVQTQTGATTASGQLVGFWKFDENGGTVAADSSGKGNNGTIQGALWSIGKVNGALSFDGIDDRVPVSANSGLNDIVNNFTISFWAKPRATHQQDFESTTSVDGSSGQKYAFGPQHGSAVYGTTDHAGVGISVGTNGVSVYEYSDRYMPALLVYPTNVSDWTHVTVVYENRQPKLYLNGVKVKTGPFSTKSFIHAMPQDIGGHPLGNYNGLLDEVRIQNIALTAEEVADLAVPPASQARLAGYWKFDEDNGITIALDSSGKGNTGTLQGTTRSEGRVGSGALSFNGLSDHVNIPVTQSLSGIVNDFSISFWAKPRATHQIDSQSTSGAAGVSGQRYAFGSQHGGAYGSPDHAGIGVSVGTNGVSVYEHADNYMPATLVHQATISDWTHVTVVYQGRQAKLYLNGKPVKVGLTGVKSFLHVVPQGIGAGQGFGYFDGLMDEVRIYEGVLTAAQVRNLAKLPAKLVAHWKLDEGYDNIAADSSGKDNHATLQGATRSKGKIGAGALSFDGINDTLSVAVKPGISDIKNNFTISFWAKPRATHEIDAESTSGGGGAFGQRYAFGAQQGSIAYGSADHAGVGVSVGTNGVSVYEHGDGYMPPLLVYPTAVSDWTHVTVVYENRQPRLYLNGTLVRVGLTGAKSFLHVMPQDIGGQGFGYFDGLMDDVRIYDGPLSGAEIIDLTSLAAQWKFDEDGGTVAFDATDNGNTGTLQGAARGIGKDGSGALALNGTGNRVSVAANSSIKDLVNNFSISFWAKPRATHELDAESTTGTAGAAGQRYVFGAQQGSVAYGTTDHAGVGVSVGTNGVSVYEHSANYMPATLVYPMSVSDWTHVTVVYENRQPKLYVNGILVKTGLAGLKSFVHAVPQDIGGHDSGHFDGLMDDVRIYNRVMTPSEVQALAASNSINAPPSITLTSPSDATVTNAPANLNLSAEAADDVAIRKVEFYANGTLIATKAGTPYSAAWGNLPAGTYSITARAIDDVGATTTSSAVNVTVNPQPNTGIVPPAGSRLVTADVVAFDQVFFYNRLGAFNPSGMIYALRRDVTPIDPNKGLVPGNVQLRADKRPRPIVLRVNAGDRLQIKFQNLLSPTPADDNQPATRTASVHVVGMQPVNNILDDGSNVGQNPSSIVAPGGTATYTLFAEREGNHLMYSSAANTGGEGNGGSVSMGLFGSVNVEARGAEWYRSQLTAREMEYATTGKTAGGQPIINYDAVYPAGHPRAGTPILKMLDAANQIIHTDLNAIITGPNKGRFPAGTYRPNATSPEREQPFREFTVVYHDEIKAVQAFPQFEDPVLSHTLHSVRDAFAINYGTGGIGSEILANRFGVGPMANCTECKYEEFFLTSWAVGDPAQVVDVPANTTDAQGNLVPGLKATKVYYPDDPSNVHHSYLNDHVKFRVVHAGPKEHHVHHLHAHQWLRTPDSDNSSYLDSQTLGPGYSFTTEIAHGGSGNRNKTVGDSIFHCHFYPHFAQGMWELWRTHDVFEAGTQLDGQGRPATGARALPDGEIAAGTPIPALVPLPTIAMAPVPTATFKGFPFYIPGVAGHRPPHPPLDTIDDGGLPRHVILGGTFEEHHTRLDFDKKLLTATAKAIPEGGTSDEQTAMKFHGVRTHASYTPEGAPANFITNGLPRKGADGLGAQRGAPYADPCVDDQGNATGNPRLYKSANIQLNLKLNKAGWHFPQSRIAVLWEDVAATRAGTRPPEPLFFRANSNDCIEFQHTNLVPHIYEQDDFQVKTPTDIMGQHIHLVKFDVTSSDGAGNGFNYEDGTFAPGEVQERIHAINAAGGMAPVGSTTPQKLTLKAHPFFGAGPDENGDGIGDWMGAQTTVQRWFADNTLNNNGVDRTLRTVFTHDHFGPSTHQQAGFYSGLVIEPAGSIWKHNETGTPFYTRADGGPTSWQAVITKGAGTGRDDAYREFLLEFADFQLAYRADGTPVNPPAKKEIGLPFLLETAPQCPGGVPRPCPEAVSADDPGTMSVNYRNEPLALRVRDPQTNTQAAGEAGDLSHAYRSNVTRADANFNTQPGFYPALTGDVKPGDPYTPLLRAYEDDNVQIRILVGGFEEGHNFGVHGIKWKFEPDDPNSGYRNNQMMGISEHYEFVVPQLPRKYDLTDGAADYLYAPGAATDDQWNGLWGLLRAYKFNKADLVPLPNNTTKGKTITNQGDFNGVCPKIAPVRNFDVTAVSAEYSLPAGTLVYNSRTNQGGQLHDPTAIMFVRTGDLDTNGKLKPGVPVEPLILRANAGDCINVTLKNGVPGVVPDLDGFNTLPMIVEKFNNNQIAPSPEVGLHPQLVFQDVTRSNGVNVGINPVQTVKPGQTATYQWYAGELTIDPLTGAGVGKAIEFGATNLVSSDPIKHPGKGTIGALIIEPQGSTWIEDANARAQATVTKPDGTSFREFVLLFQNDINLRFGARYNSLGQSEAVPNAAEAEDAEDSGQNAVNYRSEPLWKRMGFEPDTPLEETRKFDFTNVLSNMQVGGDPVTPVFTATAGTPVRLRVLMPGGHARNNVFQLHGHIWEEEPYTNASASLGSNPLTEWKGTQFGIGPSSHFDLLLKNGAGGFFRVPGDYLYRTQQSFQFDGGLWGIFRVTR